jgi:ParB-like chromosome segregation protein Spo0J
LEIIKLGLDELKPYEKNAKRHPEKQIEQIKKSIEQFGNNDPIAVWGDDNTIVEGHGRYIALKELGYTEAECIRLDHLTDEERKAYTLAHNKLTMNSDFDEDLLNIELDSILDIDMEQFGFDLDFEDDEDPVVEVEEDEFADDVESRCKIGDIWQLGRWVYCKKCGKKHYIS